MNGQMIGFFLKKVLPFGQYSFKTKIINEYLFLFDK